MLSSQYQLNVTPQRHYELGSHHPFSYMTIFSAHLLGESTQSRYPTLVRHQIHEALLFRSHHPRPRARVLESRGSDEPEHEIDRAHPASNNLF